MQYIYIYTHTHIKFQSMQTNKQTKHNKDQFNTKIKNPKQHQSIYQTHNQPQSFKKAQNQSWLPSSSSSSSSSRSSVASPSTGSRPSSSSSNPTSSAKIEPKCEKLRKNRAFLRQRIERLGFSPKVTFFVWDYVFSHSWQTKRNNRVNCVCYEESKKDRWQKYKHLICCYNSNPIYSFLLSQ